MTETRGPIGRHGEPIRALAFAGGGFDTAMQLGVTHALLVSRAQAPDVVVGISAGAVNAVALAEILKAGEDEKDEPRRLALRVARFRHFFERYQTAPQQMLAALLPDSLQIDTRRPLEALKLPIHAGPERDQREGALRSRSGLMNVFNQLLTLGIPVGTMVRGVRRVLGLIELAEVKGRGRRCVRRTGEVLRLLDMAGANLHRLAFLVGTVLPAALVDKARPPKEASAGELIFRPTVLVALWRAAGYLLSLLAVTALWLVTTVMALAFAVLAGVVCGAAWALGKGRRSRLEAGERPPWAGFKVLLSLVFWLVIWSVPFAGLFYLQPLPASGFVLLVLLATWFVFRRRRKLVLNYLRRNAIADGLFDPHPLRQLLVELFDPTYYGELDMDAVVESALGGEPATTRGKDPKRLSRYSHGKPAIRVGVAAANVRTGELETLAEDRPVVEALLAATAVVPFFPPQKIDGEVYVDGCNVANEPTRPLLTYLRQRVAQLHPNATVVHMYTVTPLPISQSELKPPADAGAEATCPTAYSPLVDVVERVLELQQFRDGTLERRLTELYSRAMPEDGGVAFSALPAYRGDHAKEYLRTWVYPIEPAAPVAVNRRLLETADEDERRRLIAETVADGCRAALEAMIQPAIRGRKSRHVSCRWAVSAHLGAKAGAPALPGSDRQHGPGLVEVCRHCAIYRHRKGKAAHRGQLVRKSKNAAPPLWPAADGKVEKQHDKRLRILDEEPPARIPCSWPQARPEDNMPPPGQKAGPCKGRATVSFLFSGGVFRGVFQLGVLNALSEVGLRPDIVAGASVGSITAAMAARVFAGADGKAQVCSRDRRRRQIQRLAATYMAIDRLVLTDRFADFVRTQTVRAAQARFSLRQIDRVVRQYDQAQGGAYGREARLVMAGLERLFYVSPFELRDLLAALRLRQPDHVVKLLKDFAQEWLERGEVGHEVLGAEPLELLITEHVLRQNGGSRVEERNAPLDLFLEHGIVLLATATNLTRGRLEILGERVGNPEETVSLLQGLLASSAFPGVFRPRWSWEVTPGTERVELLADGGVMDNLPFDAVAQFLKTAVEAGRIVARPERAGKTTPHLLFSASLQEDPGTLSAAEARELMENWPRLLRRTRRLGYNQKLRLFENAQKAVRRIWKTGGESPGYQGFVPLDFEVLTVRPRWLCGTFAFHPMLGFRRLEQARSIAHGCASTLLHLDELRALPTRKRWMEEWRIEIENLPEVDQLDGREHFDPVLAADPKKTGKCWFRPGHLCPFSRQALSADGLGDATVRELSQIHRVCGRPETHQPRA